jgi:hypothetical protein
MKELSLRSVSNISFTPARWNQAFNNGIAYSNTRQGGEREWKILQSKCELFLRFGVLFS